MSKVIWKRDKVMYKLDENENPFVNNFFTFYKNNEELKERFIIRVIDETQIEIYGNFFDGIKLKANSINYLFNPDDEKNAPAEKKEDEPKEIELDIDDYTLDNQFTISSSEEQIMVQNLANTLRVKFDPDGLRFIDESSMPIKVEQYTNEIYPDFPYKKYKLNVKDKTYINRETNVIYVISILDKKIIIKEEPRYYWSNVKDLREFLKDTDLKFNEKTDERFKRMIQEKSVYLKRRFGLDRTQIEDIEYFPLYKRLVNLYCMSEFLALKFINGVNADVGLGASPSTSNLKLGNFATGVGGGANGTVSSSDLIKNLIYEAEKELYEALYKEPGIAHKLKRCEVGCAKSVFFKVQRSFEDWK
jgi:hypothetical protein